MYVLALITRKVLCFYAIYKPNIFVYFLNYTASVENTNCSSVSLSWNSFQSFCSATSKSTIPAAKLPSISSSAGLI